VFFIRVFASALRLSKTWLVWNIWEFGTMREISTAKIEKLIAKLDKNEAVSIRDLENTLGIEGKKKYEELWAKEKARREILKHKPQVIKDYDELIKQADFANNKYLKSKINQPNPTKNYEAVINLHRKIVNEYATLAEWFDRLPSTTSADAEGVARLITSRSEYKKIENIKLADKEDIKRGLLSDELVRLKKEQEARENTPEAIANKEKLKLMLAKLKTTTRF